MKKWIPLFLFLVFAHDVAIDVLDANCANENGKVACHMSFCQDHFVQQDKTKLTEKVPPSVETVFVASPVLSSPNFSRPFFHPPKATLA
jgi:hypothetical protein